MTEVVGAWWGMRCECFEIANKILDYRRSCKFVLTLGSVGGGGCNPLMSFSEMAAEPLGASR